MRPPMFPYAYVSVRQRLCPPVSLPVSTLSTVAHQALFHRSLSNLSGFFCSSRLSCSFLFSLILSFHSSSSSFSLLLFFSSSLIFSLPIPILLTLLVLPATHLFLSKNLYREHTLRNCDVPHAAIHPFELKTLYREQIPGH